ncbi:hypothetical protein Tco_0518701, partial [Tanacetum coccineum]
MRGQKDTENNGIENDEIKGVVESDVGLQELGKDIGLVMDFLMDQKKKMEGDDVNRECS